MFSLVLETVKNHKFWSLAWAIFVASLAFFASEYNATDENTLAFQREVDAAKAQRTSIDQALELMRQHQAFFSLFRKYEDAYDAKDLTSLSKAELADFIEDNLEKYAMLRELVGETIFDFKSASFEHQRLNHVKEQFLADLLVADDILAEQVRLFEQSLEKSNTILANVRSRNSVISKERVRRMWDAVDARGEQAQDILLKLMYDSDQELERLWAKGHAGVRRTYVRWGAIAYMLFFIPAFPIWLFRRAKQIRTQSMAPTAPPPPPPVKPAPNTANPAPALELTETPTAKSDVVPPPGLAESPTSVVSQADTIPASPENTLEK